MFLLVYIGKTISFLALAISYLLIFKALFTAPFMVLGAVVRLIAAVFKKDVSAAFKWLTRFEATGGVLSAIAMALALVFTHIWLEPWYYFWLNPKILAVFVAVSTFSASLASGYNPILRNYGGSWIYPSLIILLVTLVAPSLPAYFTPQMTYWASVIVVIVTLLGALFALFTQADKIEAFEGLDQRHDAVVERLHALARIAEVLPNSGGWVDFQDAIKNTATLQASALNSLRNNGIEEAERVLLSAEAELDGAERMIADRARLSLKDELRAKLVQSRSDCASLVREFEIAHIDAKAIRMIDDRITELSEGLDGLSLDANENLAGRLEPFGRLFSDIVTARTVLRFHTNLGASLDGLRGELVHAAPPLKIAEIVGLNVSIAQQAHEKLAGLLKSFASEAATSLDSLSRDYKNLRQAAAEHRAAIFALNAELDRKFFVDRADEFGIAVYIPRTLTTTAASTGAILLFPAEGAGGVVECALDGVLLDFQDKKSFSIARPPKGEFKGAAYDIVGKRGGLAKLNVSAKSANPAEEKNWSKRIPISASSLETARDAFIFVAPGGGIGGMGAWFYWHNIALAGPAGAAIGGIVGLLVFAFLRFR